jgi:hypothetical protein
MEPDQKLTQGCASVRKREVKAFRPGGILAPTRLLAALFVLSGPVAWAESDPADEFDFLEQGEANRAAREADRAPNGNIFLEEDDEDAGIQWSMSPTAGSNAPTDEDPDEDPDEEYDEEEAELAGLSPALAAREVDLMDEDPPESGDGSVYGMVPFADNYPLTVIQHELSSVIVELPVLVAMGLSDFGTQTVWIVADVLVNGNRVAQNRQLVTRDAVADMGPTHVWVKTAVPVNEPEALIEVKISRTDANGSRAQALFSRSVPVRM